MDMAEEKTLRIIANGSFKLTRRSARLRLVHRNTATPSVHPSSPMSPEMTNDVAPFLPVCWIDAGYPGI